LPSLPTGHKLCAHAAWYRLLVSEHFNEQGMTTDREQVKHRGYLYTGANKLNKITSNKTNLGKTNQHGKLQTWPQE